MTIAYIIQERPYTDQKSFVVLFSKHRGIGSVPISSKKRLNYFLPYQTIERRNKLSLQNPLETHPPLYGKSLFCGMYLNELIYRFCKPNDPHPDIFDQYQLSLQQLRINNNIELTLRIFELTILKSCGYELDTTGINTPYVKFDQRNGLVASESEDDVRISLEKLNAMLYNLEPSTELKHFFNYILNALLPTTLQSRLFYEKVTTTT